MRRQLAFVSVTVATLVVLAALIPLATLVRNQARDDAISAAETDAQAIAAALAVAASLEPKTSLTEELALELIAGYREGGDLSIRDSDLESMAIALTAAASIDPGEGVTVEHAEAVIEAFRNREGVSIIFPDGSARGAPYAEKANVDRAREGVAVTAETAEGAEVLVPVLVANVLTEEATVVVRAAVLGADMNRGVARAWLLLSGLGLILVVVAALATDRMGRSLVRPVTALSDAAGALAEGDLDSRVVPAGPPEVAEVGEAFNLLASRLETLLREERESVADLSHRLRTPLTALRLQAETLGNRDDSEGLLADIDRVEGAVDRMIRDLRRPSADGPAEPQVADLGAVVRHRSTFWKVLADEQDRPVEVATLGGVLHVPLSPDELGTVIDTLMENVFAHTDSGSGYRIGTRPGSGQTAVLTIEDSGPGFDEEALVERGRSGGGSTGLGLDIVRKAAEKTGGTFNVSKSRDGGGRVEVVFGTIQK